MSNHNQLSEPDPNQPDLIDPPYKQIDFFTRWIAEANASGARDPSRPVPEPGDISMLPPALQEMVLKWRQEDEQANNGTPSSPDTPPSPDTPQ